MWINQKAKHKDLSYHKTRAYTHSVRLLLQAQKSFFTDDIVAINTSGYTAHKAIFLLQLNIPINKEDFEIIDSDFHVDKTVYPNGIIQLVFNRIILNKNDSFKFSYRIRLQDKEADLSDLIKQNCLFFCL